MTVLSSMAGRLAGTLISGLVSKRFHRLRAAWRARRRARDMGIRVPLWSLVQWLERKDVQEHLIAGDLMTTESAVANLAWRLPMESSGAVLPVMQLVLDEFLRSLPNGEALLISTNRTTQAQQDSTAAIRSDIAQIPHEIHRAPSVFEQDLRQFHPWRKDEAVELAIRWPEIRDLCHTIAKSERRGELLEVWGAKPPDQLADAPAEAWTWLGSLASDYGARDAAVAFFKTGASKGQSPAYWLARAALTLENDTTKMAELLSDIPGQHPLAESMLAYIDEDFDALRSALAGWAPESMEDLAIQALLLSVAAAGKQDFELALSTLEPVLTPNNSATAAAIRAAELLMDRSRRSGTLSRIDDLAKAKRLAIQARDQRRQWSIDPIKAVLVAINASVLANDLTGAWDLMTPSPEGEATLNEANDPRLLEERTRLSALTRRPEASTLLERIPDGFTKQYSLGILSSDAGQMAQAETHLRQAWLAAEDAGQQLQAAHALALLGLSMPDLSELQRTNPDATAEVLEVHKVMSSAGDQLSLLRIGAHKSPHLALTLVDLLEKQGEHLEAAEVLEKAGNTRNHPLLLTMAAQKFLVVREFSRALTCCEAALSLGGREWTGQSEALAVMFDAQEGLLMHNQALNTARRLLLLNPDNLDARWALVQCLVREGNVEDAWTNLHIRSEPVVARSPHEAHIWISLLGRFDTGPLLVSRALDFYSQWDGHEELQAMALLAISLNPRNKAFTEADSAAAQRAMDEFSDTYPDSLYFRRMEFDESNPLKGIEQELRKNAPTAALLDVDKALRAGKLPIGMGSEASRKSYVECCIIRVAGFVFSDRGPTDDSAVGAVANLLNMPVVLDPSAAVTLARLETQSAMTLAGSFTFLDVTTVAYQDALTARESLAMLSTLTMHWDPAEERVVPSQISAEEATRRLEQATRVVSALEGARRHYRPVIEHFPELAHAGTWLGSLDLAIHTGQSFWCDDAPTREVAKAKGVRAFSSAELIRALAVTGAISKDEAALLLATLVANYHVDLGVDAGTLRSAATLDGWRPRGAAATLTRPLSWLAGPELLGVVSEAVERNAASSPDAVRDWVAASAEGLILFAGDDHEGAATNLRILLSRLVSRGLTNQKVFPFILAGMRNARSQHPQVVDPIEAVLRDLFSSVSQDIGAQPAAGFLMGLVSGCHQEDQATAARIILTSE